MKPFRYLRRFVRDAVVASLTYQSQAMKRWEFRYFQRYILWLLFRLESDEVVEVCVGPPKRRFKMRLGWRIHTGYVIGMYEPKVIGTLRRHLKRGDTCVDVGGHIGYLTLFMAQIVGPEGNVVTFEPMPDNYELLEENIRLNDLKNVRLERTAVGENEMMGSLIFAANERWSWTPSATGYGVVGEKKSINVPFISLDHYAMTQGLYPRLIKIDVEGAELGVLRGAREMIRKSQPALLIEVHGRGGDHEEAVLDILRKCAYRTHPLEIRSREVLYLALPDRDKWVEDTNG